jgi:hypothetical protein
MTMTSNWADYTQEFLLDGDGYRTLPPLRRPAEYLLRKWRGGTPEMREETITSYLKAGNSLCLCCLDCPRIIQWTPPALAQRFEGKLHTTIADLVGRVACKGEGGCRSKNIALFPVDYPLPWSWPTETGRSA